MAHIKKNKTKKGQDRWQAEAWREGVRKTQTFDSMGEAKRWAAEYEKTPLAKITASADMTFGDAMRRYSDELRTLCDRKKDTQIEHERREIARALQYPIAEIRLTELTKEDGDALIEYYRSIPTPRGTKIKDSSIKRRIVPLRSVLRYCQEWYGLPNPWKKLNKLVEPGPRKRTIRQHEIDIIVEASRYVLGDAPVQRQQYVGAAFLFAIETAMRLGEITTATPNWLSDCGTYLTLPEYYTKSRVSRNVPLSPVAQRIIKGLPDCRHDEPMFQHTSMSIQSGFNKVRKKAGLPSGINGGFTFHDTRHLGIMRLGKIHCLRHGELERMVGHATPTMTGNYTHADPWVLAEGIARHFALSDGNPELVEEAEAAGMSVTQMKALKDAEVKAIEAEKKADDTQKMLMELMANMAEMRAENARRDAASVTQAA